MQCEAYLIELRLVLAPCEKLCSCTVLLLGRRGARPMGGGGTEGEREEGEREARRKEVAHNSG